MPFCLNDTFKFAFRVALSLTLAYLIPMAMGWNQPSTAATTVMLIASTGSRRESLAKGTLRVLGTIAGGIIGLLLVGAFAQDRMLYMLSVSMVIVVIFYIRTAYLNDPTLFMLTGVMVLMMYNGGDAAGAFLYGLDRTFMTIFGVVVYTLVGIYVFPPKVEQNLHTLASALSQAQQALFAHVTALPQYPQQPDKVETLSQAVFTAQQAFDARYQTLNGECSEISAYKKEWDGAVRLYQQITDILLFAAKEHTRSGGHPSEYLQDYGALREQIIGLFEQLPDAWETKAATPPVTYEKIAFDKARLAEEGHVYRGEAITSGVLVTQLRERLNQLRSCISSIDSVTGFVGFALPPLKAAPNFNWWDAENAKTAIKVFMIYWLTAGFWILFNPPGGYNLVIFGTLFVSLLSYMPVHPFALFILFTLGFIFSVPAYVFLLPQMTLGVELACFIFAYTFIGFYFLKGPITIFFLLGMFTLGLNNQMIYHFAITLTIVSLFYLTVAIVVVSHYFPFTSRPSDLILVFRERFFRHAHALIVLHQTPHDTSLRGWWTHKVSAWRMATMKVALTKLKVWSSKLNYGNYPEVDADKVMAFVRECEGFHHHLTMLLKVSDHFADSPLVRRARQQHKDTIIPQLILAIAGEAERKTSASMAPAPMLTTNDESDTGCDVVNHEVALSADYQQLETRLSTYITSLEWESYSHSDIADFYIFLNLKKNIFASLLRCKQASDEVPWLALTMKSF
ncbi:FUSC family protein [Photobacterium aphoticum]|uniref:FUSC family protein n=1 Tax=Photobacterium aphoticum TaxID=754436 RepID=UPI004032EC96